MSLRRLIFRYISFSMLRRDNTHRLIAEFICCCFILPSSAYDDAAQQQQCRLRNEHLIALLLCHQMLMRDSSTHRRCARRYAYNV